MDSTSEQLISLAESTLETVSLAARDSKKVSFRSVIVSQSTESRTLITALHQCSSEMFSLQRQFSTSDPEDRRRAMQFLVTLFAAKRGLEKLREMIANGSSPDVDLHTNEQELDEYETKLRRVMDAFEGVSAAAQNSRNQLLKKASQDSDGLVSLWTMEQVDESKATMELSEAIGDLRSMTASWSLRVEAPPSDGTRKLTIAPKDGAIENESTSPKEKNREESDDSSERSNQIQVFFIVLLLLVVFIIGTQIGALCLVATQTSRNDFAALIILSSASILGALILLLGLAGVRASFFSARAETAAYRRKGNALFRVLMVLTERSISSVNPSMITVTRTSISNTPNERLSAGTPHSNPLIVPHLGVSHLSTDLWAGSTQSPSSSQEVREVYRVPSTPNFHQVLMPLPNQLRRTSSAVAPPKPMRDPRRPHPGKTEPPGLVPSSNTTSAIASANVTATTKPFSSPLAIPLVTQGSFSSRDGPGSNSPMTESIGVLPGKAPTSAGAAARSLESPHSNMLLEAETHPEGTATTDDSTPSGDEAIGLTVSLPDTRQLTIQGALVSNVLLIIAVDNDSNVLYWGGHAQSASGISATEAIGKPLSLFLADEASKDLIRKNFEATKNRQQKAAIYFRIRLISLISHSIVVAVTSCASELADGTPFGHILIGKREDDTSHSYDKFLMKYFHSELSAELKHIEYLASEVSSSLQSRLPASLENSRKTPPTTSLTNGAQPSPLSEKSLQNVRGTPPPTSVDSMQFIQRGSERCFHVLQKASTEAIAYISSYMDEWVPAGVSQLVSSVTRNHAQNIDVAISKTLPDSIICHAPTVESVLEEIVSLAFEADACASLRSGGGSPRHNRLLPPGETHRKCKIELNEVVMGDNIYALEVRFSNLPFKSLTGLSDHPNLSASALKVGGTLCFESSKTCVFRFPYLLPGDYTETSSSTSSNPGSMHGQYLPLTFLVFEPKAVYRHHITSLVWDGGHALVLVEDVKTVEKLLQIRLREIHAAIISLDSTSPVPLHIINILLKYSPQMYILLTGDEPTAPPQFPCTQYTKRPLTHGTFESVCRQVTRQENGRLEQEAELEAKRKILSTHRTSPWSRGKKLGGGATGDVYVADSVLTGGKMAVKCIFLDRLEESQVDELVNEIDIMCKLQHPNIVHYFHCEKAQGTLNLLMELCADGSLQDLIQREKPLPLNEAIGYLRQILEAASYLHDQGIVHRDIKPANVLLKNRRVKLSDFGTAAVVSKKVPRGTAGTYKFMAPEVLNGEPHGTPCDIWSIACVLLEMLDLELPFMVGATAVQLCNYYEEHDTIELPQADFIKGDLLGFLKLCFQQDPSYRPTARVLMLHPLITTLWPAQVYKNMSALPSSRSLYSVTSAVFGSQARMHPRRFSGGIGGMPSAAALHSATSGAQFGRLVSFAERGNAEHGQVPEGEEAPPKAKRNSATQEPGPVFEDIANESSSSGESISEEEAGGAKEVPSPRPNADEK